MSNYSANDSINYDDLWDHAKSIFQCGLNSIHGPNHWESVEENGLEIGNLVGADITVVKLFAIYHDSCRLNDYDDPQHGPRAADMLSNGHTDLFNIAKDVNGGAKVSHLAGGSKVYP